MKKSQFLAILAAISIASFSFIPLSTYADGETLNDETNQPSGDQNDANNNDNWHQIGGGNNGVEDGSGDLNNLETEPAQPQTPSTNNNQTANTPSTSNSSSSASTNTTPKPNANTTTTSNKTQTNTSSVTKQPQPASSAQLSETENPGLDNTTPSLPDHQAENSNDNKTSAAQDDSVAVPETGSQSERKPFALDLDLRLAGIITAIIIVVCGLGSVIFINLRHNRKAVRQTDEDPEEFWTTSDSEAIEDDFEFPAIDLDVEEKKIKTTKAAKAEAKAAKSEKKADSKSEK